MDTRHRSLDIPGNRVVVGTVVRDQQQGGSAPGQRGRDDARAIAGQSWRVGKRGFPGSYQQLRRYAGGADMGKEGWTEKEQKGTYRPHAAGSSAAWAQLP